MKRHPEIPMVHPQELRDQHFQRMERVLSSTLAEALKKIRGTFERDFVIQPEYVRFRTLVEMSSSLELQATDQQRKDVLENIFGQSIEELCSKETPASVLENKAVELDDDLQEMGLTTELADQFINQIVPKAWIPSVSLKIESLAKTPRNVSLKPTEHLQVCIVPSAQEEIRIGLGKYLDQPIETVFIDDLSQLVLKRYAKSREQSMTFDERVKAGYLKTAMVMTKGLEDLSFPHEQEAPFHLSTETLLKESEDYERILLGMIFRLPLKKGESWQEAFTQELFQCYQLTPARAARHVRCAEQLWLLNGGKRVDQFQRDRDQWVHELGDALLQKEEQAVIGRLPHQDLRLVVEDALHIVHHLKHGGRTPLELQTISRLEHGWILFLSTFFHNHVSRRRAEIGSVMDHFLKLYHLASEKERHDFSLNAPRLAVKVRDQFTS